MDPQQAQNYYQQAMKLYQAGQLEKALDILNALSAKFPANKQLLYARSRTLLALQRFNEALQMCEHLETVHADPRAASLKQDIASAAAKPVTPQKTIARGLWWRIAVGIAVALLVISSGLTTGLLLSANKNAERMPNTRLSVLNLAGNPIQDRDLDNILHLKGLERIDLRNTQITDAGLKRLEGLTALRRIDLAGTSVSASAVDSLRNAIPNIDIRME